MAENNKSLGIEAASTPGRSHGTDLSGATPSDGSSATDRFEEEDGTERTKSSSDLDSREDKANEDTLDQHVDHRRHTTMSKSYDAAEERIVLRKLDRRLTLFLTLLYLLSFLDRSNIGNARIAGLQDSLGISGEQFDLTLVAFYVTYITFEWMILLYRLIPPHVYIACCVFSWGLVACLQATVRNFAQLLVLRAALGISEAAFGPGVPFYMTFFYRREELAYRVGLQISAAPLATSFASSLAWVIVKLSENGPLESWRALFLFEGFPSIIAAVFAFYMIPDSPATIKWLTPRERKIATLRVQHDTTTTSSPPSAASSDRKSTARSRLPTSELLSTLRDPKAWLTSLMFLSVNVSFASLPVFLPTIIHDMQFSALTSQILAAPPYLLAFGFVLLISHTSDRIANSRGLFLTSCAALSSASYATIALTGSLSARAVIAGNGALSVGVRYLAVCGAAMGLFSSVVLIITWQLNNQRSATGRGMAMTILNVVGQTGPLIGVQLFPDSDKPFFIRGMAVCAAFMGLVALLAAALRVWLARLNRVDGDGRLVPSGGGSRGQYEMVSLRRGTEGENNNEDEDEEDYDHDDEAEGLVGDGGEDGVKRRRQRSNVQDDVFRYML